MNTQERRKAARYTLNVPVKTQVADSDELLVDYSQSGCRINSSAPFTVGETVDLALLCEGWGKLLVWADFSKGKVMWHSLKPDNRGEYGIQFTEPVTDDIFHMRSTASIIAS